MDWRALFGIKPPGPAPAFWEAYLEANRQVLSKKLPLEEVCFVVFDTETTGLNPRSDRLLSIGAVKVLGDKILTDAPFERTIRQEHLPHHREAIGVHGILPGQSLAGQDETQALREFLSYTGNAVLVGHHLRFDVSILNEALKRCHAGKLRNPLIDTAPWRCASKKAAAITTTSPPNTRSTPCASATTSPAATATPPRATLISRPYCCSCCWPDCGRGA
jgi:DNA polymerase-3 subunit epsilon